ncbi:MAG: hypothetical protein AABM66_01395 [Actinomycetota bacterium]
MFREVIAPLLSSGFAAAVAIATGLVLGWSDGVIGAVVIVAVICALLIHEAAGGASASIRRRT